jgi:hypothetical protein
MTHAPLQIVLVPYPAAGSPKEARRLAPPPYPQRKDPPWPVKQAIPRWDREALRRRVEELRRETRPQVEALKAAGLAFRLMARQRRTGVPFVAA